jgi:hypothetical protein
VHEFAWQSGIRSGGRSDRQSNTHLYTHTHTRTQGRSAIFVFAVRPETVAALQESPEARSPALELLAEYFRYVKPV